MIAYTNYSDMDQPSRRALGQIRACVAEGRYRVLRHFTRRMDQRGLFWSDVLAVLDAPSRVRSAGDDDHGRPKWIIEGEAGDGLPLGIVCVLDRNDADELTLFITAYWD